MIKVGQVYIIYLDWDVWSIITITNIDNEIVHVIGNEGFADTYSLDAFQKQDKKLLAEYPTWFEAIMSFEFRKGKKNITIDEFKKNIAPYMKHGWVAMSGLEKKWFYAETKPDTCNIVDTWFVKNAIDLEEMFNIEPVSDWKNSLIEVGI